LESVITSETPDPGPQKPPQADRGGFSSPYGHLIWFTLGYAAIAFLLGLVFPYGDGFFALAEAGLLLASIELIGLWSVFGNGGYLKRLCISHLAGIVIGAAFLFGVAVSMFSNQYGLEPGEFAYSMIMGMLLIPPISVAVQLPFWFFRAVFGWQFVPDGRKPALPFTLRELFTFTFVVALAFATPQMFARLNVARYDTYDRMVTVEYEHVTNADGTVREVTRGIPQEELELQRRSYEREMYNVYLVSTVSSAVTFIIISMLAIPVVLFTFRPTEAAVGCLFSFLYSIAICLFILLLVAVLNGGAIQDFFGEVFGYVAVGIAVSISAGALPLMATRAAGFRMTSPKRHERESGLRKKTQADPA
jgi:hypothetical protein